MSNERRYNEMEFLELLWYVRNNGQERTDRTGTGTLSKFGHSLTFSIEDQLPMLTSKAVPFKSVLSELLWFIEGSGDERRLAEIHYGKPREELADKKTIWTANAKAPYWQPKARHEGDLGRVYGVQWRKWRSPVSQFLGSMEVNTYAKTTDQLTKLVDGLITEPHGRRHILMAYNPGELDDMALPPCHCFAQFYVDNDGGLSCQMYQRSADLFLGSPFNIVSYTTLTYMLAQVLNLKPREFTYVIGDAHIYKDHLEQVDLQLSRSDAIMDAPRLKLNPAVTDITKFTMDDFTVEGYDSHKAIPAPMAV